MRKLRKLLVGFLTLTLMLSALSGCGLFGDKAEESGESGESASNINSDGVELFEAPVIIADGDKANFKVVRPENNNDIISSCLSELRKIADGCTLSFGVAKAAENENTDGEILLGNTCRTQTKSEMDKIGYDDFSITYVENKIVIAAHTPERLKEAVKFLKEKLVRVVDGRVEYIGNYTYRADTDLLINAENPISDYKIVCGHDDLYMAATTLQEYIENQYKVKLEIIFDTKAKEGKEIVLGNAKRDIAKDAGELALSEGVIAVKDKDILIATKESADTNLLFDVFAEKYLSGTYTDHFNFKADHAETVNIYEKVFKDAATFTSGSDIRVMSFNVLVDIWADSPSVIGRQDTISQVIKYYMPDVVGLQEASKSWHTALKSELKNTGYKLINTERHEATTEKYGKHNFCPILYNSDTLTLIESDMKEYEAKDNQYLRIMSYAYFEHKASGEKFVVISTHYEDPGKTEEEKAASVEIRTKQTEEMIALIDELEAKYNCAVLLTGDFNTTEGSDKTGKHAPYWNLIDSGLSDAKKSADKINRACTTWHELGQLVDPSPAGSFDHIFGNDKVHFTYFNTLVDKAIINAADHCPIYADVKFN